MKLNINDFKSKIKVEHNSISINDNSKEETKPKKADGNSFNSKSPSNYKK